jgi:N-methylhydantoinase B
MPAGGGGIGDPLNRMPDSVLEDVKNGYVSLNSAKREYGVVISQTDTGGYLINRDATEKYRKTRKGL